jgi:hypothetical protein
MGSESVVRETAAWRVVRQILDHCWGGADLSDDEFVELCVDFRRRGGLWEPVMSGDLDAIVILEKAIDSFIVCRDAESQSKTSSFGYLALSLMK